jgi:hypothetical protein
LSQWPIHFLSLGHRKRQPLPRVLFLMKTLYFKVQPN